MEDAHYLVDAKGLGYMVWTELAAEMLPVGLQVLSSEFPNAPLPLLLLDLFLVSLIPGISFPVSPGLNYTISELAGMCN